MRLAVPYLGSSEPAVSPTLGFRLTFSVSEPASSGTYTFHRIGHTARRRDTVWRPVRMRRVDEQLGSKMLPNPYSIRQPQGNLHAGGRESKRPTTNCEFCRANHGQQVRYDRFARVKHQETGREERPRLHVEMRAERLLRSVCLWRAICLPIR